MTALITDPSTSSPTYRRHVVDELALEAQLAMTELLRRGITDDLYGRAGFLGLSAPLLTRLELLNG